jgi:uncharacterized protein YceH (UPF0502 family)
MRANQNQLLSAEEIRVLGCLMEKQRTTPDAYPLSLNALRLACNQSTNRDPVVDYDEAVLREALHRLERHGMTRFAGGAGSRTPKYRHLLAEVLPLSEAEHAIMCVLMLRGPQTPGELKQRGERMHAFGDLDEVGATLDALIERGLVLRMDRRPGQKEERYEQLLGGEEGEGSVPSARQAGTAMPLQAAEALSPQVTGAPAPTPPASASTFPVEQPLSDGLDRRVAKLEREVAELREALGMSEAVRESESLA